MTPQVTQILDFKPDVILFSAQGADCWNLVDGLGRLGWTPEQDPAHPAPAPCIDLEKMKAAGDLAKGIYFPAHAGANLADPDVHRPIPRSTLEATDLRGQGQASTACPTADITKGFGARAGSLMMTIWEQAGIVAERRQGADARDVQGPDGEHRRTTTSTARCPSGAPTPPSPYTAVCNSKVSLTQWDGTKLETVIPVFSGIDLVAGTELKPGP